MQKYGSKRGKTQATKGQAAKGGLVSLRDTTGVDIEIFLEGQTRGEADNPHCLIMLYEMFPTHCRSRMERGRANSLLRPSTGANKAGP